MQLEGELKAKLTKTKTTKNVEKISWKINKKSPKRYVASKNAISRLN